MDVIVRPLCHVGRDRLDFGRGFYVTEFEDQAERWAVFNARRMGRTPLVNVYELDKERILAEARCLVFEAYDRVWLDFIAQSRQGANPSADYDYVEGGVANDRVIDTVNLFIGGLLDAASALQRLTYHRPNNQICLLNQELTDKYLHYVSTRAIH